MSTAEQDQAYKELQQYFASKKTRSKDPRFYASATYRPPDPKIDLDNPFEDQEEPDSKLVLPTIVTAGREYFEICKSNRWLDPNQEFADYKNFYKRQLIRKLALEVFRYLDFDPDNLKDPTSDIPRDLLESITSFSEEEYKFFLEEHFTDILHVGTSESPTSFRIPKQAGYKIALDKITKGFAVVPNPIQAPAPGQSGVALK